jgi:hypothetical protein
MDSRALPPLEHDMSIRVACLPIPYACMKRDKVGDVFGEDPSATGLSVQSGSPETDLTVLRLVFD